MAIRDNSQPPADKYPAAKGFTTGEPIVIGDAQRGPGPRLTNTIDNRPELERQAAERAQANEIRDDTESEPKVEPLPEIPGLFIFTGKIMSAKAGTKIDRIMLRSPNARQLTEHGSFIRTIKRTRRDEVSRQMIVEEETTVDFGSLAKHVAAMSGLSVMEVESLSAYDMMRLNIKVQDMMYSIPS